MKKLGWYEKPGVTILEGKWQDFMESNELLSVGGFDVVYTDTFSEDYGGEVNHHSWSTTPVSDGEIALHQFFGHLPDILSGPESRFSFFNGLGATRIFFCN